MDYTFSKGDTKSGLLTCDVFYVLHYCFIFITIILYYTIVYINHNHSSLPPNSQWFRERHARCHSRSAVHTEGQQREY